MMIDTSVNECVTWLQNKNSEHIVVVSPSVSWKMPRCRMVSCMKNSPIWWWFPPLLRVMRTVRIILSRGHSRKQPKGGHIFPNLPTLTHFLTILSLFVLIYCLLNERSVSKLQAPFPWNLRNTVSLPWIPEHLEQLGGERVGEIKYASGFKHRLWNPTSWD